MKLLLAFLVLSFTFSLSACSQTTKDSLKLSASTKDSNAILLRTIAENLNKCHHIWVNTTVDTVFRTINPSEGGLSIVSNGSGYIYSSKRADKETIEIIKSGTQIACIICHKRSETIYHTTYKKGAIRW